MTGKTGEYAFSENVSIDMGKWSITQKGRTAKVYANLSIRYDTLEDYHDKVEKLHEVVAVDKGYLVDRVKTIELLANIVSQTLEGIDLEVKVQYENTPATPQAEKPSSQAGRPEPPTQPQEAWGQWEPKYPEVDEYLIKECGFTRSKFADGYARLEQDRTVYINRSKANDKWVCKDGQKNYWNTTWGELWNSIIAKIAELARDK